MKHVTLQKIVAHDFRYDPRIMLNIVLNRVKVNVPTRTPIYLWCTTSPRVNIWVGGYRVFSEFLPHYVTWFESYWSVGRNRHGGKCENELERNSSGEPYLKASSSLSKEVRRVGEKKFGKSCSKSVDLLCCGFLLWPWPRESVKTYDIHLQVLRSGIAEQGIGFEYQSDDCLAREKGIIFVLPIQREQIYVLAAMSTIYPRKNPRTLSDFTYFVFSIDIYGTCHKSNNTLSSPAGFQISLW